MVHLLIRHTIADYAIGARYSTLTRPSAGPTARRVSARFIVTRGNPNQITTLLEWDNAENAHRFSNDLGLKEAMQAAGVTSAPEVHFLNRG